MSRKHKRDWRDAIVVRLELQIEPTRKRDGYHTRLMVMTLELPMPPFVGLKIYPDSDSILCITEIGFLQSENRIKCCVVEELYDQPETESEVDKIADVLLEEGWRDVKGSEAPAVKTAI